jgi:methylmalonyl-CoA mutase N-terminal domain/subunit
VLALPTDKAAEIALRTQQVLLEETGVAHVADPLGGSWYVEELTDRMEQQAEAIFARIRDLGDGTVTSGLLRGIEEGWFVREIGDAAFAQQRALEEGRRHVVGVDVHTSTTDTPLEVLRISAQVEHDQVADLARRRAERDPRAVAAALDAVTATARSGGNLVPPLLDAARAEATLGEMCQVLRLEFGSYTEPVAF